MYLAIPNTFVFYLSERLLKKTLIHYHILKMASHNITALPVFLKIFID